MKTQNISILNLIVSRFASELMRRRNLRDILSKTLTVPDLFRPKSGYHNIHLVSYHPADRLSEKENSFSPDCQKQTVSLNACSQLQFGVVKNNGKKLPKKQSKQYFCWISKGGTGASPTYILLSQSILQSR